MGGQEIADLQVQNQFAGLAEQNSSEDEQYEESFMGEGQIDQHSEEEEKVSGTPETAASTPSPAVPTPEMFNRSPTPTPTATAVPSPADFGPPGMNGTPSFAPYSRTLPENLAGIGQREQVAEPVSISDLQVQQLKQHGQQSVSDPVQQGQFVQDLQRQNNVNAGVL